MARSREKSATEKIFENILFLAEVFGDKSSGEIPNVPVLELARCFELKSADPKQASVVDTSMGHVGSRRERRLEPRKSMILTGIIQNRQ